MTEAKEAEFDVIAVLNIVDLCKDLRTLPLPGGLLDQDSLFVDLYEYVSQLRYTRADIDQRKQEANARLARGKRR